MMETSTRSDAGRSAGLWALGVLESVLGPDWPERAWKQNGEVPGIIRLSAFHAIAFAELLELALRLHLHRDAVGAAKLRKELRGDPRPERLHHTRLQLEVGALAACAGSTVMFEIEAGRAPADVIVVGATDEMRAETFAVFKDAGMRAGDRFWDELSALMMRIRLSYDVEFDGHLLRRLRPEEIAELLEAVEGAAAIAVDQRRPERVMHLAAEIVVVPAPQASGTRFSGPIENGRGWERVATILVDKARQARRSNARCLRVNLHDGMWQFNPWASWPLPAKTDALTRWVRDALAAVDWLDGVVLSSGDAFAQGEFYGESYRAADNGFDLRRLLDPLRVRETIIAPTSAVGGRQATEWVRFYDLETMWLGWALGEVGLGTIEDVTGWEPFPTAASA